MRPKIVVVIQARMGATRLPNKEMLHLHGYPVCEWIFRRVSWSEKIDDIIFAIPATETDKVLEAYLLSLGAKVFKGSESDVLGRTITAAEHLQADFVVRVCADNPFIDGREIDNLIDFFFSRQLDYAYNHIPRNNRYPDGLGAEMVSFKLLKQIDGLTTSAAQREHTLNYIWDNQGQFSIGTFDPPERRLWHPEIRLDLDSYADYLRYLKMKVSIDISSIELIEMITEVEK